MKIFKHILMIGAALISCCCAYNQINQIPISPQVVETDLVKPLPLEAGLLITEQTKGRIFQSQSIPEIITEYFGDILEPYQLPVGQAFEEASIKIFSRIFQKIHLIRNREEGANYPLIIEPQLLDFDFHLGYSTISHHWISQIFIDARSQAAIRCSLKTHDRVIWQDSIKTPAIFQRWFDDHQLPEKVGHEASETITRALGELAVRMAEDSRKPQAVRGWLRELNPEVQDSTGHPKK